MDTLNENQLSSLIKNSGNSDVDVNIQIDIETKSIAYAMLCSQFAKGDLSEFELEKAIKKLNEIIDRDKKNHEQERREQEASDSRRNIFQFPGSEKRRDWNEQERKEQEASDSRRNIFQFSESEKRRNWI